MTADPTVAGSPDLGLAAVGERHWWWPRPTRPGLCWIRAARSDAGVLGEHRGRVVGGSGWSGAHLDLAGQAGRYSGKVQQPVRTWPDRCAHSGMVTCGNRHRWTCCLWMACKRSGVRIPLAPQVRDKIRKPGHPGTAGKYSSGDHTRCRAGVRISFHPPPVAAGKVCGWQMFGAVSLPLTRRNAC